MSLSIQMILVSVGMHVVLIDVFRRMTFMTSPLTCVSITGSERLRGQSFRSGIAATLS
jgi:hypothetical protein